MKSTVGHLLTGAGAAGLAKVLLAMPHRTLPPTANFERPSARLGYDGRSVPDPAAGRAVGVERARGGRRSTAFGFGGINAHVLVEEFIA